MKRMAALLIASVLLLCACTETSSVGNGSTTTTATTAVAVTSTTEVTDMNTTTVTEGISTVTTQTDGTAGIVRTTKTMQNVTTVAAVTSTTGAAATTANGVVLIEPGDKYVVESQSPLIEEYLGITDEKKAAEFWVATYTGMAHAASFTARWQSKGMLWRVYVAEDPSFKDAQEYVTTVCEQRIANLMPGRTYYWKVVNGYGVSSEVRSVTVENTTVRWIEADGGDNIRDLGGWKTESGKTVRYELLYRGACIDGYKGGTMLSGQGKETLRKRLGIRTELDVRGSDVVSTESPFGAIYVKATMTQYDLIYSSETSKKSLGKIFKLLSNEANYPVYFHCNAGADRTGTLAYFINGLLGVSFEDLTRDFELTGFSSRGQRLRSALDMETLTFTPDGVMQKNSSNHIAWGPLHRIMMSDYGTGSGKLSDAIANFLKTECGVTQEQIDAVRRIMLK